MTVSHFRRELVEWSFALSVSIIFIALAFKAWIWVVSP